MDKETSLRVTASLVKAAEKLKVAERLFRSNDHEDAVSRSYYAAFHAAQALLFSENLSPKTHQGVFALFGLRFVKTNKLSKVLAKDFAALRDSREASDYEIFTVIDKKTAKDSLRRAKLFVSAIQKYLTL